MSDAFSELGLIGSPGAFKANLLNLRQRLTEIVAPLNETSAGLPWQKANQLNGYKPLHTDFEHVLQDVLTPDDQLTTPVNDPTLQMIPQSEPDPLDLSDPPKKEQPNKSAIPPQLARNMDLEQRMIQQGTHKMFFNYIAQPVVGHYRTELARNAYNNALGRTG
ncbi:MAG: hypothetical protein H7839_06590 [Magnetococcus sp. YQC-5]